MVTNRFWLALVLASALSSPALGQDSSQQGASGAFPVDMAEWAGQIQQNYPSVALRNEEEGVVSMRIIVDTNGRVSQCEVTSTSESEALDAAACDGMRRFARYNPARDEAGAPVESEITQSIRYVLPEGATVVDASNIPPPPEFRMAMADALFEWQDEVFDDVFLGALRNAPSQLVIYGVTVDVEGKATGCGIVYPSGDPALDTRTCAKLVERGRFLGAEMADGTPIPGAATIVYPPDYVPSPR